MKANTKNTSHSATRGILCLTSMHLWQLEAHPTDSVSFGLKCQQKCVWSPTHTHSIHNDPRPTIIFFCVKELQRSTASLKLWPPLLAGLGSTHSSPKTERRKQCVYRSISTDLSCIWYGTTCPSLCYPALSALLTGTLHVIVDSCVYPVVSYVRCANKIAFC